MTFKSPCIEFIRHGLPEGGNRYRGSAIDDPLSELGWQQMWQAMGEDKQWDLVVSSPLKRCRAFAEEFAQRHDLEWRIEQDLTEVGFGAWEGKTKQQLMAEDKQAFERFYQDPVHYRPQDAEPLADLIQRVGHVFDQLCSEQADKRTLVVAHAGVMRAAICHVLDLPLASMYRITIDNAARLRFELGDTIRMTMR
ncbi:MAG: alpha-ribazole phosphatase family protein [Gammaproteobacteria bacterium]|nr:alpha-ribazole phosphatase family protein [Gammaproteobacteria bacterium]